uniref:Uncharacterized protein n=1 Tax=Arundo donax TaxID=35708 RepID=A0A0A8ZWU4_ARUDO
MLAYRCRHFSRSSLRLFEPIMSNKKYTNESNCQLLIIVGLDSILLG